MYRQDTQPQPSLNHQETKERFESSMAEEERVAIVRTNRKEFGWMSAALNSTERERLKTDHRSVRWQTWTAARVSVFARQWRTMDNRSWIVVQIRAGEHRNPTIQEAKSCTYSRQPSFFRIVSLFQNDCQITFAFMCRTTSTNVENAKFIDTCSDLLEKIDPAHQTAWEMSLSEVKASTGNLSPISLASTRNIRRILVLRAFKRNTARAFRWYRFLVDRGNESWSPRGIPFRPRFESLFSNNWPER